MGSLNLDINFSFKSGESIIVKLFCGKMKCFYWRIPLKGLFNLTQGSLPQCLADLLRSCPVCVEAGEKDMGGGGTSVLVSETYFWVERKNMPSDILLGVIKKSS